jgi:hypothetical protein
LNAVGAEVLADHVIVLADTHDVYEQILVLGDRVGAAYVGAHEKVGSHVVEYQTRLASGYDSFNRAASAHLDFVKALTGVRAELHREIATACGSAFGDIAAIHRRRLTARRHAGAL